MPLNNAENIDTLVAAKPEGEPIRIGLISDTHIPRDAKMLPPCVKEVFKNVDLILHAGDIYLPDILDELETIAPVRAARGNGDWDFPEDDRLSDSPVFDIGGLSLGLTHAIYYPASPEYPLVETTERKFGKRIDIIVFGDTHVALVERYKGILLVNPGSPTVPNGRFELGTVALLEIMKGSVEARIIRLSEFPLPF